jgi:light-harvesting protein B-800-850 alpha chain
MNQGRIWCVVNPTVGLPLFLGSAALTSLVVHASVLTHSTWFSSFMQGGHKASAAAESTIAPVAANMETSSHAYAVNVTPAADGKASFVISVAPKATTLAATEPSTAAN